MNRELKFRIWDELNKTFVKDPTRYQRLAISCDGRGVYSGKYDDCVKDRYIICQYTGLKDKNGKDIYEGDIVSGICLNDGPQICVVGFDTFGIFYTKIKFYPCEEWDNVAMLAQEHNEIIGNIFENSELLK